MFKSITVCRVQNNLGNIVEVVECLRNYITTRFDKINSTNLMRYNVTE